MESYDKPMSMTENKEFWDDLFDGTPLKEDPVGRKLPDLKNCIDPNELPEYS